MRMGKISVRWCVDLRFNDLSGIFLTEGYKRVTTNGNRKRTYPADVTRDSEPLTYVWREVMGGRSTSSLGLSKNTDYESMTPEMVIAKQNS